MRAVQPDIPGFSKARASQSVLWPVLVGAVGASLWAQVFYLPVADEIRFANPSLWGILGYLLPVLTLLVGVVFRRGALTLLGFLVSFLPGIFMLPQTLLVETESPLSLLRIGVTLAAYIAVAAAGAAPEQLMGAAAEQAERIDDGPTKRLDGLYRFYFALRGLILFGLLFVIQYAVFRDPALAQTLAESYPSRPEAAATFIGIFSFFAWCVAAYSLFFVPLMNIEYDVRNLSREIDRIPKKEARSRRARALIWLALALLIGAALWILNNGF